MEIIIVIIGCASKIGRMVFGLKNVIIYQDVLGIIGIKVGDNDFGERGGGALVVVVVILIVFIVRAIL